MLALKRLASAPAAQRQALGALSSVRRMGTLGEELKGAPSKEEEAKYAKVIKVGDKLYGVPAVQEGTFGLDLQQQVGRRWEELVYELNGEVRACGWREVESASTRTCCRDGSSVPSRVLTVWRVRRQPLLLWFQSSVYVYSCRTSLWLTLSL